MKEYWKAIPGYAGYEASNLGRIRSINRVIKHDASLYQSAYERFMKSVVLKPYLSTLYGYETVKLYIEGKKKSKSVHILVCLAFNGLPPSLEKSNALHRDGVSLNNKSDNLYWGTLVENWDDMRSHGRDRYGEKHPLVKISLKDAQNIYDCRLKGISNKFLSQKYGISPASICDIFKGRTWPQVNRFKLKRKSFYFHPRFVRERRRKKAHLTRGQTCAIKVR